MKLRDELSRPWRRFGRTLLFYAIVFVFGAALLTLVQVFWPP